MNSVRELDSRDPSHVLRIARLASQQADFAVTPALAEALRAVVDTGVLDSIPAADCWPLLADGLMSERPSRMLAVLRDCGALAHLLPELDALFGIPQSADEPPEVDVGEHQLRVLDQTAAAGACLEVRWAALLHKLGKAGSPKEFLPSHMGHEQRGAILVEAVCDRFGVSDACRELALLVVRECDKVHRAVDMRAAAIAGLLDRVEALGKPERFERLLQVCTCDYLAYPGHETQHYPKAERLRAAFRAYREPDAADLEARAKAVAQALRSEQWKAA